MLDKKKMNSRLPDSTGFVIINKETDWTSFDVVAKMRSLLKIKKIGHGGTLDPAATGVLILCCGKATRLSKYLLHGDKEYKATIKLGRTTDTYDAEGQFITAPQPVPDFDEADLQVILNCFTGEIEQYPPIFSAIKVGGKKLYEYARKNQDVEIKPKLVTINSITIQSIDSDANEITINVACGSGTYIRSLAHDIGVMIGCGAYLKALERTRAGEFSISESVSIAEVESMLDMEDYSFFRPASELLPNLPKIRVNAGQEKRFTNGNFVVVHNPVLEHQQQIRVLNADGSSMIGLGEVQRSFGSEQIKINPKLVIN